MGDERRGKQVDGPERRRRSGSRIGEEGSVMIFVIMALGALIAITAWSTETGRMWQAKGQLQAAADASALAGVGNLLSSDFQTVYPATASAAAIAMGAQHAVLGETVVIPPEDVQSGSWALETETFTPLPGSTDPTLVRAVRVAARRDDASGNPIPTILARAVGVNSLQAAADAVAYWGFAGGGGPGSADLPITIDCCAVSGSTPGSACTQNYCDTIASNVPNPCPLSTGGTATCLEFHSNPDQNACWTSFDGDSPAVNTPDLVDIVEGGNSNPIDGPVYVDNGDKVPVIREIRNRFHGTGGYSPAEGTDTNGDGSVDSWVVTLPLVECQNPGDQCAGGDTQAIVGFVCFDIHEVLVTPEKIIKGTFLCSSDPRCDNSGLAPGGNIPGSLSAQYPVLVD